MPIAYNEQTGEAHYLDDNGQWSRAKMAQNPQTGEKFVFDGKAWSPLKVRQRKPSMAEQAGRGVKAGLLSIQDALTFGTGDEIAAGLEAGGKVLKTALTPGQQTSDFSQEYNTALRRNRAELQAVREAHPVTSTINQIGAGLLVPMGAAASSVTPLRSALQTGAIFGGASGYGSGEGDVIDRLPSATMGAGLGALGGAVAYGAGVGLKGLGRVVDELVPADVRETAFRKVEAALARDKKTPQQFAEELTQNPELLPAAKGRSIQGLADALVTRPGETGERAAALKREITASATQKVSDELRAGLGTSGEFYQTLSALDDAKRAIAAPAYEKAYSYGGNVWNDSLAKLSERPSVKKGMANALRIAAEEGQDPRALGLDLNEAGDVVFTQVPSMKTLDYVKRGLDDVVEAYRDPTSGKLNLNTEGRAVNDTLRQWVNALDEANPDYKIARDAWAGPTKAQAAIKQGEGFITERPEEIAEALKGMTVSEKDYYRLGAERKIIDLLDKSPDGADVLKRLVGDKRKRDQLAALYPDRAKFDEFIKSAETRIENYNVLSRSLGGSQTEPRRQAAEDFDAATGLVGDVASGAESGGITGAIAAMLRSGSSRIRAPRESVANEAGAMLFPRNALERQAFINRLRNGPPPQLGFMARLPLDRLGQSQTIVPLSALTGQQLGLAQAPEYYYQERQQ